jgi:hypothetical protein
MLTLPDSTNQSTRQGLEPDSVSGCKINNLRQIEKTAIQEFTQVFEVPVEFDDADTKNIHKIIAGWKSLSSEVQVTILSLVKHSSKQAAAREFVE